MIDGKRTYYIVYDGKKGDVLCDGWCITITNANLSNPIELMKFIENQQEQQRLDKYRLTSWRLIDDYEVAEPSGPDIIQP